MRVKILPRLASSAPFLRLMVDHLLCPDIVASPNLSSYAQIAIDIIPEAAEGVETGDDRRRRLCYNRARSLPYLTRGQFGGYYRSNATGAFSADEHTHRVGRAAGSL